MRIGAVRTIIALCCLPLLTVVAPAPSSAGARMWDVVRSAEWELTVRSVERRIDPLTASDGALVRPAGRFAIFAIDLTNRTDRPLAPTPGDFVLGLADGGHADSLADTPAARTYATANGRTPFGHVVPPGVTVTTIVLFDIAADAGRLTLHFLPANRPIRIDECKCNLPSPVRSVSGG